MMFSSMSMISDTWSCSIGVRICAERLDLDLEPG